jgi:hypothetical protein
MNTGKSINFFFALIALITGWTLYKHIDFKTFQLADPVLDLLYLIVFVLSIYFIIKGYRKQPA